MSKTILCDRYVISATLGRGGSAMVHRAHDLKLKRDIAIKLLSPGQDSQEFLTRFQKETEWMAGMSHPNIVTIYDAGEHEGKPFLVMELVDGKTLLEIAPETPLRASQVCALMSPVCRAMAYSHERNILHRDLTLRNIMVEDIEADPPVVKVLDFGLAKLLKAGNQTTRQLLGTPYYISPEMINGQGIDFRSDIFSFGVCLYRLLNGFFPFQAEHPTATIYQICNETPPEFHSSVPSELKQLALACLAKNPEARPQSFSDIADVLEHLSANGFSGDLSNTIKIIPDTNVAATAGHRLNPYLNRVMIKNPGDFFGREREVRKIYSRLDAPHPQSISIVGERRIGKSSLLNHIYNRSNRQNHMRHYRDAIFVYLDFQSRADFTVAKFIDFLSSVFRYENRSTAEPATQTNGLDWLQDTVRSFHESGKRIILLMDEFERITRNPNFDAGFFSFLRSLANSYRVAYVTSSCDELQNMCHNKDISDSPFFNIFSNLPLRPFSLEEATELISQPSAAACIPLAPYSEQLIALAGCFPFFLQIACSCLFEILSENPDSDPNWSEVTRTFLDEVQPHFEFIWNQMDEPEKENLRRMAANQKISRKFEFVNEDLLRRGYLREQNQQTVLFSDCFRDFILAESTHKPGKKFSLAFWKRG